MYSINFWLRHQNHTINGTPIYCRIKINSKASDFFTGLSVLPNHFDKQKQRFITKKNRNYVVDNEHLENIYEDVKLLIVRNPELSAAEIKNLYCKRDNPPTLHEIFSLYLKEVVLQKNLADGTVKKWKSTHNHIKECFNSKTELKESSCIDLYNFVITNRKSKNNHAVRTVKYFESAMVWAKKKNLITGTIDTSNLKRDSKQDFNFLEEHQTRKLCEYDLDGTMDEIRDLFIFICFTGFDYCDFKDFDPNTDVDFKQKRIYWNRGKNENARILPLFPEAKRILEKYDMNLPQVTNALFNKTLKVFGSWLGLRFPLTTKIGRKTAGMWLLNEGVPLEVVQVILGHKDIRTTQRYYARILPKSVFRATAHLV